METKECQLDEGMEKFFARLHEVKKMIKKKADETGNPDMIEIYNILHQLFKVEGK